MLNVGKFMKSNTNYLLNSIAYLVTFGFLFPIGFSQYFNFYKRIQNIYILCVALLIAIFIIYRILSSKSIEFSPALVSLITCYIILLIITMCRQHSINQGYQKIFFIPLMCIFINSILRLNFKLYINVLGNLLIGILFLNLIIFNQLLFSSYFYPSVNNTMFIGHVQTASEIGILSVFVGLVLKKTGREKKGLFLFILALLTMVYSRTMASYLALIEFLIFGLLRKERLCNRIISNNIVPIFFLLIVLNYFLVNANSYFPFSSELDLLSSGRVTIWYLGLLLVEGSPISGYGDYGAKIKPYWIQWMNNNVGFNYAHNTILQLLLDGGIILTVMSIITLLLYINNIKRIHCLKLKYFISCLLLIYLSIGMVESLTEYNYFFIFLSFLPFVKYLSKDGFS